MPNIKPVMWVFSEPIHIEIKDNMFDIYIIDTDSIRDFEGNDSLDNVKNLAL